MATFDTDTIRGKLTSLSAVILALAALLAGCAPESEERADADAAPGIQEADSSAAGAAPESGGELAELAERANDVITADYLREVTTELSSDAYLGRAPAGEGDAMTRQYLARQLQMLGFQPGGESGSYMQPFALVSMNTQQPEQWTFSTDADSLTLQQYEEFIVTAGVQEETAALNNAELVFVGYGIQAPEYDWDDFKDADLSGKVLLMLNNDPDWDPDLFAGNTRLYYGRWSYKYESAARQGAAGAIIIHTTPSAGYPWQVVQTSWSGEQFELPATGEPRLQARGWVTEEAARELVALGGHDLDALVASAREPDFQPQALGVSTSIELPVTLSSTETANVIGVLPGNAPDLSDEAVILTAHHDHLGVAAAETVPGGDRIYNGALDNAAGVALVLGVARAYSELELQPKRDLVVNFVGAEEQGLLGSQYYAQNPTYPPGRIAATLNVDAPNVWGPTRDITYIGYGKSDLDEAVEAAAAVQDRVVVPDQFPDRGFFYRSDQFSFARIGVPSTYLDGGTDVIGQPEGWGEEWVNRYTDEHYHQPSDEIMDDWNFEGTVQDAVLNLLVSWQVINQENMPMWNPGDEFEQARLEALEAAAE